MAKLEKQTHAPQSESDLWSDDAFGRREDAEFLQRFLVERTNERRSSGRRASYVLNLDAAWGRGKSYFLDRFGRMLEQNGYLVARVNAWEDDHADDPLIAVMAAIERTVSGSLQRSAVERRLWKAVKTNAASIIVAAAKGAAEHWARKAIGEAVGEVLDIIEDDASDSVAEAVEDEAGRLLDQTAGTLLQKFSETKKSIAGFKHELSRLLASAAKNGSSKLPLFVLVDELDRCRPTYAIILLERVKHLFDIDGVVFLIATDTGQLKHSIGAVYGQGFDAEKYLFRFFDRTYVFEQPSRRAFVEAILSSGTIDRNKISLPPNVDLIEYISGAVDYFNLTLRDCEQCIDILRSVLTAWDIAFPVEIAAMFPIVIAFQQQVDLSQENFSSVLQKLASDRKGASSNWSFVFGGFATVAGLHAEERILGSKLCQLFRNMGAEPFVDLLNRSGSMGAGQKWVRDQIAAEHEFLSGLRGQRERRSSMINDYPKMVRSAGRIRPI